MRVLRSQEPQAKGGMHFLSSEFPKLLFRRSLVRLLHLSIICFSDVHFRLLAKFVIASGGEKGTFQIISTFAGERSYCDHHREDSAPQINQRNFNRISIT